MENIAPAEESQAQKAARLRREKRNAKILNGGSDRLNKITSLSGRPAPMDEGVLSTVVLRPVTNPTSRCHTKSNIVAVFRTTFYTVSKRVQQPQLARRSRRSRHQPNVPKTACRLQRARSASTTSPNADGRWTARAGSARRRRRSKS